MILEWYDTAPLSVRMAACFVLCNVLIFAYLAIRALVRRVKRGKRRRGEDGWVRITGLGASGAEVSEVIRFGENKGAEPDRSQAQAIGGPVPEYVTREEIERDRRSHQHITRYDLEIEVARLQRDLACERRRLDALEAQQAEPGVRDSQNDKT